MSSEGRPHLRPVEPGEARAGGPAPAPPDAPARGRGPLLLLLVALVLLGGLLWQARESAELRGRLTASELAREAAEGRVAALETRAASVRERLEGLRATLQDEFESLGALLAEDAGEGPGSASPDASGEGF